MQSRKKWVPCRGMKFLLVMVHHLASEHASPDVALRAAYTATLQPHHNHLQAAVFRVRLGPLGYCVGVNNSLGVIKPVMATQNQSRGNSIDLEPKTDGPMSSSSLKSKHIPLVQTKYLGYTIYCAAHLKNSEHPVAVQAVARLVPSTRKSFLSKLNCKSEDGLLMLSKKLVMEFGWILQHISTWLVRCLAGHRMSVFHMQSHSNFHSCCNTLRLRTRLLPPLIFFCPIVDTVVPAQDHLVVQL